MGTKVKKLRRDDLEEVRPVIHSLERSRKLVIRIKKWEDADMAKEQPPAVESHIFNNAVIWPSYLGIVE